MDPLKNSNLFSGMFKVFGQKSCVSVSPEVVVTGHDQDGLFLLNRRNAEESFEVGNW